MAVEQTGLRTFAEMENALTAGNTITPTGATTLVGGGDSTQHFHAADRARANHTGTQLSSTISDFQTQVSANSNVTANTAKISYTDGATVTANTADVDASRDSATITGVTDTYTADCGNLRRKKFDITTTTTNAITIALSNVTTANTLEAAVKLICTAAPSGITHPTGYTYNDATGPGTLTTGQKVWFLYDKEEGATTGTIWWALDEA